MKTKILITLAAISFAFNTHATTFVADAFQGDGSLLTGVSSATSGIATNGATVTTDATIALTPTKSANGTTNYLLTYATNTILPSAALVNRPAPTTAEITNAFAFGSVILVAGTNQVTTSRFSTNLMPMLSYVSLDGNVSMLMMKPSEYVQGTSFTIRSANSADTNMVKWFIP